MEKGTILVELQEWMGSDRRIAESAWTSSYDLERKANRSDEDVERVVKLLIGSDPPHAVPVESVVLRFWLRLPVATDRQWMTHRMQSANGLSGRYRTVPDDFLNFPEDCRYILESKLSATMASGVEDLYNQTCKDANESYRLMLEGFKGAERAGEISNAEYKRLREVVRGILPQANMVERTSIMNLRSFSNFQKQRNDGHAQPEIRYIAQRMLEEVESQSVCPIAIQELKKKGWRI